MLLLTKMADGQVGERALTESCLHSTRGIDHDQTLMDNIKIFGEGSNTQRLRDKVRTTKALKAQIGFD